MEKAEVMVFASLEKAKIGEFDKYKKENRKEDNRFDHPQPSHSLL